MVVMQMAILVLVALAGTGVALTRDPTCQAMGVSFFGLMLALMFLFGGWRPENHYPLGTSFVIDPLGAGLAALVALLVLAAFVFSWHYFESIKTLYHATMLVFLAAMCGLCLTGDLFNLFVWFELMTAAGGPCVATRRRKQVPCKGP